LLIDDLTGFNQQSLISNSSKIYFAVMMKWPRRFCCQQASVSSEQTGCSSPLLTFVIRSVAMPRLPS
jgi:hypothetical protein